MTRALSPASLPATGGEVAVSITIVGAYGGIGSVVETLPAGFSYVSGSSAIAPTVSGQNLSFSLLGETSLLLQGYGARHRGATPVQRCADVWD